MFRRFIRCTSIHQGEGAKRQDGNFKTRKQHPIQRIGDQDDLRGVGMSLSVTHLTGKNLFQHRDRLDEYLDEVLRPHVAGRTWMGSTSDLARRFQLFSFTEKTKEECVGYDWDSQAVDAIIHAVLEKVRTHIPLDRLDVTIVPALPFRWFREFNVPASRWSNGFTNGPGNLIVAVPPQPDWDYLANLIAHECHHACPENPIYHLTLETFTLAEWIKMEGTAEYFSHLLYPDDRWWWASFPEDKEPDYWRLVQPHLDHADDAVKGRLAFGSKAEGIPTFAGYTFGYRAVAHYVSRNPDTTILQLYRVSPRALIETYMTR